MLTKGQLCYLPQKRTMASINKWLKENRINANLVSDLEALGAKVPDDLVDLETDEVNLLCSKLKTLEERRFRRALKKLSVGSDGEKVLHLLSYMSSQAILISNACLAVSPNHVRSMSFSLPKMHKAPKDTCNSKQSTHFASHVSKKSWPDRFVEAYIKHIFEVDQSLVEAYSIEKQLLLLPHFIDRNHVRLTLARRNHIQCLLRIRTCIYIYIY